MRRWAVHKSQNGRTWNNYFLNLLRFCGGMKLGNQTLSKLRKYLDPRQDSEVDETILEDGRQDNVIEETQERELWERVNSKKMIVKRN